VGQASLTLCTPPLFFRAPLLPSNLHKQWDQRFFVGTSAQLQLHDMSWEDVWLPAEEREIVQQLLKESKCDDGKITSK
jgi:hypothetical protein